MRCNSKTSSLLPHCEHHPYNRVRRQSGSLKGSGNGLWCRRVIATLRAPDAIPLRQCPTKNDRLAIATLRAPDARFAQSKVVKVRSRMYAPTLRCRYVATTRLIVENDYVAAPSFRPRRGFAVLAKCFRLDTASAPAHPRSDVATWQQRGDKLSDWLDTTFTATHFCLRIAVRQQ